MKEKRDSFFSTSFFLVEIVASFLGMSFFNPGVVFDLEIFLHCTFTEKGLHLDSKSDLITNG